ncbi:MAG: NAD(P)H-dependent oxidoreductase [Coriobacteriales bacterium]|nr:NAD(P)H-dependent oxidoreductase [Coriobacteriales bacterium]
MTRKIGVLLGSFRRAAFTRSVADAAIAQLSDNCEASIWALDELPLFNQDYDDDGATPPQWAAFREQVAAADAVLVVTPEYNRSFPAVLKNALDIASRPAGENRWAGKPGAVISVSPGRIGGALANQHIRQPLAFLGISVLQQPELYISDVASLLDADGHLSDERTLRHLKDFITAFEDLIG